jgi:hypothetical protein
MTIEFQTPAEAFIAVAWVVCTADKCGSPEERDYLYEQVRHLDIFEHCDRLDFEHRMGLAFNKIFHTLPCEESALTDEGVECVIHAVNKIIGPDQRVELFRMACGLAAVDALSEREKALLAQFQEGFGIEAKVAREILGTE